MLPVRGHTAQYNGGMRKKPKPPCIVCGTIVREHRNKYCSPECYHEDDARQHMAAFWTKVRRTDGCWEWTGQKHMRGYGLQAVHHVKRYTHRISWELTNGPIPAGMVVMHRCDNPPCVRPDHLVLGTKRDNTQDMLRKGRGRHQKAA